MKKLLSLLFILLCVSGLVSCGEPLPNSSEAAFMEMTVSDDPSEVAEKIKAVGFPFKYTHEVYESPKDNGNDAVLYYAKSGAEGDDYLMAYRYESVEEAKEAMDAMSERGVGAGLFPDSHMAYVGKWVLIGKHDAVYAFFGVDPKEAEEMNGKNSEEEKESVSESETDSSDAENLSMN